MYAHIQEEVTKTELAGAVLGLCRATGVSRSGYYRWQSKATPPPLEAMQLQHAIQEIALERPAYGYRRVTEELRHRGWEANHKRVLRLLRQDNLLCVRKQGWVRTTDSHHGLPVYPNLARGLVLTAPDQLWVADITYIRLQSEFVYLAVILDAYSRRVIGWNLGRSLETELALTALRHALAQRTVPAGLVHHSDRGVQYASQLYTDLLRQFGITISMSRRGNPYDNAYAESFMKTLKHEEVHRYQYRNLEEAQERIERFIETVYNHQRLHSALGYISPMQFEANLETRTATQRQA